MSRKIGMDTICLRPTPRVGHMEFSMSYHKNLLRKYSGGLDPSKDDETLWKCYRALMKEWDYDMLWSTHDGPINWQTSGGRYTDLGHAAYAGDGSDERKANICPFSEPEEVWEFDPAKEYGVPEHESLKKFYREWHEKEQADNPGVVFTGGYYRSVVSGAIESFGWDMLLLAASDEEKFARVLGRFGDYTMNYVKAQAEVKSIEVFVQHDDMVWTGGPFIRPEFYRSVIFPIYKKLWSVLKKAGKKVLFNSDGTWEMFVDDIAACGADGFIFEPSNNLDIFVRKYGKTHCIVASKVDCRTMTFKPWDKVKAEIDATLALAKKCPGFIFTVGNHIPANVSDETCELYIDYLKKNWKR
jgi:hypothetical protein